MNWQQEQQAFWDLITRPHDLRDSAGLIDDLMAPHRALSTAEALGIYNNAYHQRLIQISAELYPVTYHTLGHEVYTRLWLDYIAAHPPRPGAMALLGEQLLTFTRQHAQFGQLPALLDIIELESLLINLYDKADEVPYTRQMLMGLPASQWPHARWQARQDWALLHSRFDLEQYWVAMQPHLNSAETLVREAGIAVPLFNASVSENPTDSPNDAGCLLVRRVNHRMQFQQINKAMALFLQGIQARHNFAQLCEALAQTFPDQDIPALSLQLLIKTVDLELLVATPTVQQSQKSE